MLYQQGAQRIEVIVRKESGGGEVSAGAGTKETPAENTTSAGGENEETLNERRGLTTRTRRIIKTNASHFIGTVKQITDLAIEYRIGGIGYRNGDQAHQDIVSRKVEKIKDVTNIASSVAMGAVYGSWGGPIGMVVGAALSAASSGASLAVKYANRKRDYDYEVFKENSSISYQRSRAGLSLTYGRLR